MWSKALPWIVQQEGIKVNLFNNYDPPSRLKQNIKS